MAPLIQTLVSGLALVSSVVAQSDCLVDSQILTDPYKYDFPRLGGDGAAQFAMRPCHGFKLEEATIDQIQAELEIGTFTGVQLLECYMDRVHQTQPYLKYVMLNTCHRTVD
jgi:amidase